MRISAPILQSLAAAVALAGISGCGYVMPAPRQQPTSTEEHSADPKAANHERPGQVCEPDGCPACGRG
jgi:hypothetical protein